MVIIGLLAGYVGTLFFAQIKKSEIEVAHAQIDAFGKALDQYGLDVGHYPSTGEGLQAPIAIGDRPCSPLPSSRGAARHLLFNA